jgi:hypothetical protein
MGITVTGSLAYTPSATLQVTQTRQMTKQMTHYGLLHTVVHAVKITRRRAGSLDCHSSVIFLSSPPLKLDGPRERVIGILSESFRVIQRESVHVNGKKRDVLSEGQQSQRVVLVDVHLADLQEPTPGSQGLETATLVRPREAVEDHVDTTVVRVAHHLGDGGEGAVKPGVTWVTRGRLLSDLQSPEPELFGLGGAH